MISKIGHPYKKLKFMRAKERANKYTIPHEGRKKQKLRITGKKYQTNKEEEDKKGRTQQEPRGKRRGSRSRTFT